MTPLFAHLFVSSFCLAFLFSISETATSLSEFRVKLKQLEERSNNLDWEMQVLFGARKFRGLSSHEVAEAEAKYVTKSVQKELDEVRRLRQMLDSRSRAVFKAQLEAIGSRVSKNLATLAAYSAEVNALSADEKELRKQINGLAKRNDAIADFLLDHGSKCAVQPGEVDRVLSALGTLHRDAKTFVDAFPKKPELRKYRGEVQKLRDSLNQVYDAVEKWLNQKC